MATVRLPPFVLHEPIGDGATGEVWRATHDRSGLEVAVKVLRTDRGLHDAALMREVHAVTRLDHPAVIRVHDVGRVGAAAAELSDGGLIRGSTYLVMELARSTLRETPPRAWRSLRGMILATLDGLAHAHARGVVHRDIKPANILIPMDATTSPVVVADFGLAAALDHAPDEHLADRSSGSAGTPRYMAPEQVLGDWSATGPWTDLYALGCVVWELACGRPPFQRETVQQLVFAHLKAPVPAFEPTMSVPDGLEGWLRSLLAKHPRVRVRRAADAAWGILGLGDPGATSARSPEVRLDEDPGSRTLHELATLDCLGETGWVTPSTVEESSVSRSSIGSTSPTVPPPVPPIWHSADSGGSALPTRARLYGLRRVPILGRISERDHLWRAVVAAEREGMPRCVAIVGAAGVGKSALARWVSERAHELGSASMWRANHHPVAGRASGLEAMLASLLHCRDETPDVASKRVRTLLDSEAPWLGVVDNEPRDATLPELDRYDVGALVSLVAPQLSSANGWRPPIALATPEQRWATLARLLQRRARERPVIVWLDDVQWGADSLGFARFVMQRAPDERLPVLFVLTAREEALQGRPTEARDLEVLVAGHPERAERLQLSPFERDTQRALVRELLHLDPELADAVVDSTDGNPLFAVQLVGDWIQRGLLRARADDRYELTRPEPIPGSLVELWLARAEDLVSAFESPNDARSALEIATLLGPDVDDGEWERACAGAGLRTARGTLVESLARAGLAHTGRGGWSFAHGSLAEALEERARIEGRLAWAHDACAKMLREGAAGRSELAERIARHLLGAGRIAPALDALLDACAHRRRAGDLDQVDALLDDYDRALERDTRSEGGAHRGALGRLERAHLALERGRLAEAETHYEAARADLPPGSLAAGHGAYLGGIVDYERGRTSQAREGLLTAIAALDRLGDERYLGACHHGLGDVEKTCGDLSAATRAYERAIEIALGSGSHLVAGRALNGLAGALRRRGRHAEALERLDQAAVTLRRLGNDGAVAMCLNTRGEIARMLGRLDDAQRDYEQAVELLEWAGVRPLVPQLNLLFVRLARGDYERLRAELVDWRRDVPIDGNEGYTVYLTALELAANAGDAGPEALRALIDTVAAEVHKTSLHDADMAAALEAATERLRARGELERAREVEGLAREQRELG